MEPKQGAPKLAHEGQPDNRGEAGYLPDTLGERFADNRPERGAEAPARLESEGLPPVITPVPVAIPAVQDDSAQVANNDATLNPAVAADDDLIEKEWVDKAKKIIEQTKEDPYKRELEIGKLQRDYIRKRYGREIGESGDT